MKTVKVLRIINRFNLGGITYNVSYLSRYMSAEYHTMLIGGPEEDNEASSLFIPRSLGLDPLVIGEMRRSPNILQDYMAYRRIKKIIREFRPHIVHTHASKAGAIGRLAAAHSKVPIIVHTFHGHVFRGYFGSLKTGIYKSIERFLAGKTHAVVAISEKQKEELANTYRICSAEKIHVVPLGFDLQRFTENKEEKRRAFRSKFGIAGDVLVPGIIGRLVPIKHHELYVEAVAACIRAGNRKITGVIVGDGESREFIKACIKKNNCTYTESKSTPGDFILTGWVREIDGVLPALDIVCLTSKNEGTPVSLIEAQVAGKFIVSTNVGGIADILHPGCGLLSEPGDSAGYKNNLMKAVKDYETLASQAGEASDEVMRKFSYRRLCQDMENLYAKLLRDNSL